jgi:hypothetical protein
MDSYLQILLFAIVVLGASIAKNPASNSGLSRLCLSTYRDRRRAMNTEVEIFTPMSYPVE